MLPQLAATAAAMSGSVLQYLGQEDANRTNVQLAHNTNQWNSAEAEKTRKWQEQLSNTAHQRAVEDLKKAGLNPILAANGGASTPSGATASGSAPSIENSIPDLQPVISTALEAKRLGMAMQMQDETIKEIKARTAESQMRSTVMSKDIPKAEMINEAYKAGKKILNNIMSPTIWSPKNNPNLQNYIEGSKKIQLRSN